LSSDGEINGCLAKKAVDFVSERFPGWDWALVVFNFEDENREVTPNDVSWDCDDNWDYGCIHLSRIVDLKKRHYHFQFRRKDGRWRKNWGDVLLYVTQSRLNDRCAGHFACNCADPSQFWWNTTTPDTVTLDCPYFCHIPNDSDPDGMQAVAKSEHGFIGFRTETGIPRVYYSTDSSRFDVIESSDMLDLVPYCDQKYKCTHNVTVMQVPKTSESRKYRTRST
jgi:hypothetical protein